MSNIIFGYGSMHNIMFRGEDDSGYSEEEWLDMSEAERNEVLAEFAMNLVDVWVKNEPS